MDHIKNQLDTLAELDADGLSSLEASIRSEFKTLDDAADTTAENVDAMLALADALESVQGEQARRAAEAEELSARRAEASARVNGTGEEPEEVVEEVEEEPSVEEEEPEAVEASAAPEVEEAAEFSSEEIADEAPVTTEAEASVEEPEVEAQPEEVETAEITEVTDEAPAEDVQDEAPAESEAAEVEEVSTEAEAAVEAPAEAEASNSDTIASEETQEEAQTVTAAAEESFEAPADRQPVLQDVAEPVATIVAGADVPGRSAGTAIKNMDEVAQLMEKRIFSLRNVNGGDGEQLTVASIQFPYNEAQTLDNNHENNWKKITEAKESGALVAAGGFQAPAEVRYDIFGLGDDWRPVKASLPKFRADRGGIQFVVPPQLAAYDAAVGVWTSANDAAGSPNPATKASLTVTAAQTDFAYVDAITLQLQIGNLVTRAWPELVARHNELALIQHAREAEIYLLGKINAGSTQVTAAAELGVARDFLVQVRQAATAYRSRHRINPRTNLQVILPTWVVDAIAADLTKQMPGDDKIDTGIAQIEAWLRNIGISLTASPDMDIFGAQDAGALDGWPTTFKWFLFSEGTFLFLDGGTLDLGIIRDSGLVSTNDYKMFVETFEGIAKIGIESIAVTSTFKVTGEAAALTETNAANNPAVTP